MWHEENKVAKTWNIMRKRKSVGNEMETAHKKKKQYPEQIRPGLVSPILNCHLVSPALLSISILRALLQICEMSCDELSSFKELWCPSVIQEENMSWLWIYRDWTKLCNLGQGSSQTLKCLGRGGYILVQSFSYSPFSQVCWRSLQQHSGWGRINAVVTQ